MTNDAAQHDRIKKAYGVRTAELHRQILDSLKAAFAEAELERLETLEILRNEPESDYRPWVKILYDQGRTKILGTNIKGFAAAAANDPDSRFIDVAHLCIKKNHTAAEYKAFLNAGGVAVDLEVRPAAPPAISVPSLPDYDWGTDGT